MEILREYKQRKGEHSAGKVYFHWFCTSVFPNSNDMSSKRPIFNWLRHLLYLITIIIIIIKIRIYLALKNSQRFTIQRLEITILNSNYMQYKKL